MNTNLLKSFQSKSSNYLSSEQVHECLVSELKNTDEIYQFADPLLSILDMVMSEPVVNSVQFDNWLSVWQTLGSSYGDDCNELVVDLDCRVVYFLSMPDSSNFEVLGRHVITSWKQRRESCVEDYHKMKKLNVEELTRRFIDDFKNQYKEVEAA